MTHGSLKRIVPWLAVLSLTVAGLGSAGCDEEWESLEFITGGYGGGYGHDYGYGGYPVVIEEECYCYEEEYYDDGWSVDGLFEWFD